MKVRSILSFLLIILLFVGCSNDEEQPADTLSTEELKDLVHQYSIDEKDAESASITSTDLIIAEKNGNETSYSLPDNEFFVSIAPFINETHPCTNHSLTGCQGELSNTSFDVYIEDTDGNVIVDETVESFDNGFIDLWLPRDKNYQAKIKYDGKVAESKISTFEDDGTCITTMQLM
ncbi:CueP family metal-binding protein [Gracilibacillus thailandensis]|uniref:CueP family metal-binding protein n=1 Tax=Gracilibacillus thailandensis TaxID=563735 RepID=A0A6N7R3L3_9BACI|nr:CueP family metal-binding protein [Gracilibacillus thailandensis]MRI67803.1 hypothetical protein [Gracilibacillus thailandensis]